MGAKGRKNLTEKEFEQIKVLKGAGLKNKQIAEFTRRSVGTVGVLVRFDKFQDYQEYNRQRLLKKPQPRLSAVTFNQPPEDIKLILEKIGTIELLLNELVNHITEKESTAKLNKWRFGGSR